jgi:AcrR family transcriptional regulator
MTAERNRGPKPSSPARESSTRARAGAAADRRDEIDAKDGGPTRLPLRQAQKLFTHNLLLEVAIEVFQRDGYVNATVDQIVTEASATRATFYQHFGGKIDVIRAILDENHRAGNKMMSAAVDTWRAGGTSADVRSWLESCFRWYEDRRGTMQAIDDAAAEDRTIRENRQDAMHVEIGVLADYLTEINSPVRQRYLYAMALLLELDEFMRFWIVSRVPERLGRSIERDDALELLTRIWCDALLIPLGAG